MSGIRQLVEQDIAVWNETGPAARRAGIDAVFATYARHTDPPADVTGRGCPDPLVR